MTEEEKWDMFMKYVSLLEDAPIGRKQLEDSKALLEQLLWGELPTQL